MQELVQISNISNYINNNIINDRGVRSQNNGTDNNIDSDSNNYYYFNIGRNINSSHNSNGNNKSQFARLQW